jgi:redox-sensitive bicupin YhaK (pirin superfamily)
MVTIRRAAERGHFDFGWLNTHHTFSFGEYHDPGWMGFRSLRVINDDIVQPGKGFGMHPHRNMEIITWVLSGKLAHKDSTGGEGQLGPGEVQRMTAGTGILHSEFNASPSEPVRLLQIWIEPARRGVEPGYEQFRLPAGTVDGKLGLIATPDGGEGVARINQDARVYAAKLAEGQRAGIDLAPGRGAWVQVARGRIGVNGAELSEGDGAAIEGEPRVDIASRGDSEVLVFDLA